MQMPARSVAYVDGRLHWLRHSFIVSLLKGAPSLMPLLQSFSYMFFV